MVLSIAGEIERCDREKERCLNDLKDTGDVGAFLGWCDWEAEKRFIIREQNENIR